MTIVRVRQFWDAHPCNLRHSQATPGTLAFYQEARARKFFVEPHIVPFSAFPAYTNRRVLEIGCGLGIASIEYAANGASVTAVDLSKNSLHLAHGHAQAAGVDKRITFVQADAEHLRDFVRVEPFDLIYSFGVLHHTPHPEKALRELRSYCHPGTRLKLMVYHKYSTKWLKLLLRYGANAHEHSEANTGCPVTFTYSRREAQKLVESAGFQVEQMRVDHIFPYQVEAYRQYHYARGLPWSLLPASVFRMIECLFGWHLLIDARVA